MAVTPATTTRGPTPTARVRRRRRTTATTLLPSPLASVAQRHTLAMAILWSPWESAVRRPTASVTPRPSLRPRAPPRGAALTHNLLTPTPTLATKTTTNRLRALAQSQGVTPRLLDVPAALSDDIDRAFLQCPIGGEPDGGHHSSFKEGSGLENYTKAQYIRPFLCDFNFVSSQHLLLNNWLCQQDSLAKITNLPPSPSSSSSQTSPVARHCRNHGESSDSNDGSTSTSTENIIVNNSDGAIHTAFSTLPNGAIFNRKYLYTQHLRRTRAPSHVPASLAKAHPGGVKVFCASEQSAEGHLDSSAAFSATYSPVSISKDDPMNDSRTHEFLQVFSLLMAILPAVYGTAARIGLFSEWKCCLCSAGPPILRR